MPLFAKLFLEVDNWLINLPPWEKRRREIGDKEKSFHADCLTKFPAYTVGIRSLRPVKSVNDGQIV